MAVHQHAEKPASGNRPVEIDIEVESVFRRIVEQSRAHDDRAGIDDRIGGIVAIARQPSVGGKAEIVLAVMTRRVFDTHAEKRHIHALCIEESG
ncbi:hypothetical protein D3C86_1889020 [compost metagenome]